MPGLAAFHELMCWSILDRRIAGKAISLRRRQQPMVSHRTSPYSTSDMYDTGRDRDRRGYR